MHSFSTARKATIIIATFVVMVVGGVITNILVVEYWIHQAEYPFHVKFITLCGALIIGSIVGGTLIGMVNSRQRKLSNARRQSPDGYFGKYRN